MIFFELVWTYILIFLLAAVPFVEAIVIIPIAILAGLSPILVLLVGISGNLFTVLLVILFIHKIKEWRNRRKKEHEEDTPNKRTRRAQKLWNKYGLPGLAILGPFFVGSHLTAFLSLGLGGTKKSVIYWVSASVVFWSVLFAGLAYFGFDFLHTGDSGWIGYFQKLVD